MHKTPTAALDWLALRGRAAHWLSWSGVEPVGVDAAWRVQRAGLSVVNVCPSSYAVGSGTWGSGDKTPGMKA